jgi:hypothetical protein
LWHPNTLGVLRAEKHDGLACILEIFGNVSRVFDSKCMSKPVKDYHCAMFYELFHSVFGEEWYKPGSFGQKVLGIPITVWLAFKRNIDSRWFLLESVEGLQERYLSTYDLEGAFSALVAQLGYKPTVRMALALMNKLDRMQHIILDTGRGFSIPTSRRAKYGATAGEDTAAGHKRKALEQTMYTPSMAHHGGREDGRSMERERVTKYRR